MRQAHNRVLVAVLPSAHAQQKAQHIALLAVPELLLENRGSVSDQTSRVKRAHADATALTQLPATGAPHEYGIVFCRRVSPLFAVTEEPPGCGRKKKRLLQCTCMRRPFPTLTNPPLLHELMQATQFGS